MPVVLRKGPYRFRFFSNENREPAHVHVSRARMEAKFWLDPVVVLQENGGFGAHEITRIMRLIEQNRAYLMEKWNEYHRH